MSNNSLASLLAWMKNDTRMLDWGLIVALERRKANLLIIQEYIKRFGTGSYLPAISGEVPIVENQWKEFIADFTMDVPRLSFENADLNDSKAMLTMAVVGGSQITLKKESVGWKANKVAEIDPLQGPKLYLDLLLNQVPGDVDEDGRVILDLSKSDNFRLTFGQTAHEQRMGGDFFKDLFNTLPDDERIYPLGKIERGTNELMRPQSFELRTQASSPAARDSASAEHGNGAILAFIRTMARNGGNYPGAGYKYLIPDDQDKDYSATVLFDRRRVVGTAFLAEMAGLLGRHDFEYGFDDGEMTKATAKSGGIFIRGRMFTIRLSIDIGDGPDLEPLFLISLPDIDMSAVHPSSFEVDFTADKILVRFKLKGKVEGIRVNWFLHEKYTEMSYAWDVEAEYEFVDEDVSIKQTKLEIRTVAPDIYEGGAKWPESAEEKAALYETLSKAPESDPLGSGLPGTPEEWHRFWLAIIMLLSPEVMDMVSDEVLEPKIREAFKKTIKSDISVASIINETIKLNFGQAIQGSEILAPRDVGFFGRINPTQTSFVIAQMEPLLKQGGRLNFTTEPVVPGVRWSVENLVSSAGNPGTIDRISGLYQAPMAASIKGRFTRARVIATDPGTGYHSSALVTVVKNELTVNPLIQTCDVGGTVELAAGVLGEGELHWSIKNPVKDESGTVLPSVKPEGDHTYHHGPVVANKTYVIDEIEVKTGTGPTRSVHVLALQKQPGVTVSIDSI